MSYLDKHKAYMNINGNSIGDQRVNEMSNFINSSFTDDFTYKLVTIDGVQKDARILDMTAIVRSNNFLTILNTNKYMLLRPGETCNLGSIVEFDNITWMATDNMSDDALFPKSKIEMCNATITVITGETKTITSHDSMGRPIYNITNTSIIIPCIAGSHSANGIYTSEVNLANDRMLITVKYDDTAKVIKENDVYTLFERNYRVSSIDFTNVNNNQGFISLNCVRVVNP